MELTGPNLATARTVHAKNKRNHEQSFLVGVFEENPDSYSG